MKQPLFPPLQRAPLTQGAMDGIPQNGGGMPPASTALTNSPAQKAALTPKPTKGIPQPKTPRAQKVIQGLTKPAKPSSKRGTSTGYMAGSAGATLNNAASTAPTALL